MENVELRIVTRNTNGQLRYSWKVYKSGHCVCWSSWHCNWSLCNGSALQRFDCCGGYRVDQITSIDGVD